MKKSAAPAIARTTQRIDGALAEVFGSGWKTRGDILDWPPNAFAAACILLKKSGAYTRVLAEWPPRKIYVKDVQRIATKWRGAVQTGLADARAPVIPREVVSLWGQVVAAASESIESLTENSDLAAAIIELMACCDEFAVGLGLPSLSKPSKSKRDYVAETAKIHLNRMSTLAPIVPSSIATVLPKQHSPKNGLTLRSMSHHLGVHFGREVVAKWITVPEKYGPQLNLVLAPWPTSIRPKQFTEASCDGIRLAKGFKFFEMTPDSAPGDIEAWTKSLLDGAIDLCGKIDGVVFPEASMSLEEYKRIESLIEPYGAFLVAGVGGKDKIGCLAKNQVFFKTSDSYTRLVQCKHHRWRLDRSQIEMYGIGGNLDPQFHWWENIEIDRRTVNFATLHGFLTMCCLVCEDLARQDPVAELVRTVGPNLVIALLADGPQLAKRWPSRYATVLADDPGSSVLTMTSLGMAELATPPPGEVRSRAIALWKDAFGSTTEISVPANGLGVVLSLQTQVETEWTADGRSDNGAASFPRLVGVHAVMGKT